MLEMRINNLSQPQLFRVEMVKDRITVSARELHEFLQISTEFAKWMHRMCEYNFSENEDYEVFVKNDDNSKSGRPATDYRLTIEMAKEICMIQRNEKGKQARLYFIELEKEWNSPAKLISRALLCANNELVSLRAINAEMKPKAMFADAVSSSKASILVGDLAKLVKQNGCNLGQNRLFSWLRENGYLMKSGSSYNMPTQKSMEMKLFEIKETTIVHADGHTTINKTPKVTGKGQIYFVNKFCTPINHEFLLD